MENETFTGCKQVDVDELIFCPCYFQRKRQFAKVPEAGVDVRERNLGKRNQHHVGIHVHADLNEGWGHSFPHVG